MYLSLHSGFLSYFLDFDFEGREINQINRGFMHFSLDKIASKKSTHLLSKTSLYYLLYSYI